jgi:hypothetical protein
VNDIKDDRFSCLRIPKSQTLLICRICGGISAVWVAHMQVPDIAIYKDAIFIELPRSKTDQESEGRKVCSLELRRRRRQRS